MRISLSKLRQIIREEIKGQLSLNEMGRARKIRPGDERFDFINMTHGSAEGAPDSIEMINLPDVVAPDSSKNFMRSTSGPVRKTFVWTQTGETVRAPTQYIAYEIFKRMIRSRVADEINSRSNPDYEPNRFWETADLKLEDIEEV